MAWWGYRTGEEGNSRDTGTGEELSRLSRREGGGSEGGWKASSRGLGGQSQNTKEAFCSGFLKAGGTSKR